MTLGKNGTWTRRAVYIVTNLDPEGGAGAGAAKALDVSDSFVLPSGEGWKLSTEKTKDEKRVIAERTLPLDQAVENDIVVKETPKSAMPGQEPDAKKDGAVLVHADGPPKQGKPLTSNSVSVRQVSPGRYEYTETLHWTGEKPANMHKLDEKGAALVKSTLPPALATDENVTMVAAAFSKELDLALIGPPTPLIHRLPMLMSAPDTFARLLSRRVGPGLMASLKERFGDRMTAEQRLALTGRLIQGITDEIKSSGPDQASGPPSGESQKNSSGASIFVSVKLPGRVVATNGTVDNFSREITWSFYPEAAAFGDIKLTATCDAAGSPTAR